VQRCLSCIGNENAFGLPWVRLRCIFPEQRWVTWRGGLSLLSSTMSLLKQISLVPARHAVYDESEMPSCESAQRLGTLTCIVLIPLVAQALSVPLFAQEQTETTEKKPAAGVINHLLDYLNMAGTRNSNEFQPQTQAERTRRYLKTWVNPISYVKAAFSAGIDQANDKPTEWEQGASGYGKRYLNILGQYTTQRLVTFGLESALHEDNRYFNSGKHGFWPRTGYALSSGILARHDDGSRHFSISQVGGVAAGAFLARAWLPPSQSSASAGAVSFAITMGSNVGFSVVKEFLPDLGRRLSKKNKKPTPGASQSGCSLK